MRMESPMTQTPWILFIVFLNVVLAEDWSVNLPTGPICAVTGSTVDFPCSYDFPQSGAGQQYRVMSEMWCLGESRCITQRYVYHSAGIFPEPSYQSRAEYLGKLGSKKCDLKISNVRQSDSGTYVFYLITNHTTEKMPAQSGVQLLVAGYDTRHSFYKDNVKKEKHEAQQPQLWVKTVSRLITNSLDVAIVINNWIFIGFAESITHSHTLVVEMWQPFCTYVLSNLRTLSHIRSPVPQTLEVKCLAQGDNNRSSTEVTVLAGPSSKITEGESVHLSCCTNSGAKAKWYKTSSPTAQHLGPVWTINKAMSEDSGSYYCQTETKDKIQNSTELALDVQYPPRNTVVSLSSEETQAGRPVTLTCSSDANPPVLTYNWFKDAACDPMADTSFLKAMQSHATPTRQSQTLSRVNVSADESEVHCCVARNRHGSEKYTVKLSKSLAVGKKVLLGVSIVVVLAIIVIIAFIIKRKKTSSSRNSYVPTSTTVL